MRNEKSRKKDFKVERQFRSFINFYSIENFLILPSLVLKSNFAKHSKCSTKSVSLLLALIVIPVFWGTYNLNDWIIMMGLSFVGLCLMQEYRVDHKNIKLLCNTFIRGLKLFKLP